MGSSRTRRASWDAAARRWRTPSGAFAPGRPPAVTDIRSLIITVYGPPSSGVMDDLTSAIDVPGAWSEVKPWMWRLDFHRPQSFADMARALLAAPFADIDTGGRRVHFGGHLWGGEYIPFGRAFTRPREAAVLAAAGLSRGLYEYLRATGVVSEDDEDDEEDDAAPAMKRAAEREDSDFGRDVYATRSDAARRGWETRRAREREREEARKRRAAAAKRGWDKRRSR